MKRKQITISNYFVDNLYLTLIENEKNQLYLPL